VGNGARARAQARVAKDVCSACDVRSQCLAFALAANLRHGVFGGLGEEERREVRRRERLRSAARGGPGSARL
jgi:WhiB family redox-sensing transcriptional regulator